MNKKFKLQIPMTEELRIQAEKYAVESGFDSIQAFVRFLLKQTTLGNIKIGAYDSDGGYYIPQSAIERWKEDIKQMEKDSKSGKIKEFTSAKGMMNIIENAKKDD
jgi:hypothetical protein